MQRNKILRTNATSKELLNIDDASLDVMLWSRNLVSKLTPAPNLKQQVPKKSKRSSGSTPFQTRIYF